MKFFDSLSGLVNAITGTGTSRDKATAAVSWVFHRMPDSELVSMYRSNWLAAKIINIPVDDMLREGWRWQAAEADMTKLEEEERRLGLRQKLHTVLVRDSLYGGGALVVGDGASDPSQPLNPEMIGLGGIKYLMVTGRGELTITELETQLGVEYGQPKMFELQTMKGPSVRIHPSRVFTFNGQPVPTPNGLIYSDDWWGDSRLASVTRDIAAASAGITGVGRLMDELAVAYHKINGLAERLAEKGGEEAVRRMLTLVGVMKSSINAAAIDSDDEVEIITASFTGIPEAIRSLMENLSGAADIPLTRFLGSSPGGLNATGDSDIRNYYDRLAGRRAHYIEPQLSRLDDLLIRSALGRRPDDIYRVWNPLWQMTAKEQADYDKQRLESLKVMADGAFVHDHVIEKVARNLMIDSPSYPGAEKAFDEADKLPEPTPEDVAAANALQAAPTQPPAPGQPQLRVVGDAAYRWNEETQVWDAV